MIHNTTVMYLNEFSWQDVELTDEFKKAYSDYLEQNSYNIDFMRFTSVITSSSTKYIFVPNQWFVIAHYVVDIYDELQLYKRYFKIISDSLGKKTDEYAKVLRDEATILDKNEFIQMARNIFSQRSDDDELINEAASRLWRFVNDYSWWSGQKTIDRGDFHLSVILNMLNLVNASQSYVGDIVSAFANDPKLRGLVKSVDSFTVNFEKLTDDEVAFEKDEEISKEVLDEPLLSAPEEVTKIKISTKGKMKEIVIH